MSEEKQGTPYEDLRETVEQYSDERGSDFLTDPKAVAEAKQIAENESALDHGQRLRAGREAMGFTLEELSEKSGIARDVLIQVEAGETLLPLGQLIKLSNVLSLRMADAIAEGLEAFTIVRASQRKAFKRFGQARQTTYGYEFESLAPGKKDRKMEPFIVTLHPGASGEPSTHEGQEFIFVLEGQMEAFVEETQDVLGPGDAIYYDATSNHLVRAYGDKPAKILAVLVS
jgi:quercetin dioxygenase-like cupin family protein/ribosome-binding protein aMBF1 (putative translation factor)